MAAAGGRGGAEAAPDYEAAVEKARAFLIGSPESLELLARLRSKANVAFPVHLDRVQEVTKDPAFVAEIIRNAARYSAVFCEAVDSLVDPLNDYEPDTDDALDTLRLHRREREQQLREGEGEGGAGAERAVRDAFPRLLLRRYYLHLVPRAADARAPIAVRRLRAGHIGALVTTKGIVTRVSEVKPLALVVAYSCDLCGFELYQEVRGASFLPLLQCSSRTCRGAQHPGKLHMSARGSRFVRFQELRLQELAEHVPMGHIPRTLAVHALADLTRLCSPGDVVSVHGIFLPTPYVGGRSAGARAGLIADTYLEATYLEQHKKSYKDYRLTPELLAAIQDAARAGNVYDRLARSLAPEIYGLTDVKKSLLLQLMGGVPRRLPDQMRIRGDIHVCLMGDPGVAKSQLLKHVALVAPRGVYTSGKGSSGVGLTAAVLRDPVSNELVLEGGALVLADTGVCCIDEFDKMADADRTAIHEVMEQQTVSIAKAGITTSLNARTTVLAAANPAYGRYNPKRTVAENINLPAALLSRFDLLFVLLDVPSLEADLALARHVSYVHQHGAPPPLDFEPVSAEFLRGYIAAARAAEPTVPRALTDYIVSAYVRMRADESGSYEGGSYCTARTLLSILRLAQALARLRMGAEVAQPDVDEALRLFHASKASLLDQRARKAGTDPLSAIYGLVRDSTPAGQDVVALAELLPKVVAKGYTQAQLDACLARYEALEIWKVATNRASLRWLQR